MNLHDCKRVLVFGGSFDPPHNAHVSLPRIAAEAIGADCVAYIPAAQSPLKQDKPLADGVHRLKMLQLALKNQPWAEILTLELERASNEPSYTVDTLEQLRAELGEAVELRLLVGADQLRTFDRWHRPRRIVELAMPVIMVRPPDTREAMLLDWPDAFPAMPSQERASTIVELPVMDISSSTVRDRLRVGEPLDGLVPPVVEAYIAEHGLYV